VASHHTTPRDHQVKSQTNFLTAERRVEGEKLNKQLERAVEDRDKLLAERAGLVAELQAVQVTICDVVCVWCDVWCVCV